MVYKKFDPSIDYQELLKEDEIKYEDGNPFVYLKGLERLAKERGIVYAKPTNLIKYDDGVIVTYEYGFVDGASYAGSADATTKNCKNNFKLYLTAIAESRAKARALRTAFGISLCSVEEKADIALDEPEDLLISDEQAHLIKIKMKQFGLKEEDLLKEIKRETNSIGTLTKKEAIDVIKALNKYGRKRKANRKVG